MLIIDFGLFKLVRLFDKTMENVCSFDFIFECYPNRNFSLFSVFIFIFPPLDMLTLSYYSYMVHILSVYIY